MKYITIWCTKCHTVFVPWVTPWPKWAKNYICSDCSKLASEGK